jgi:hypothetical protein
MTRYHRFDVGRAVYSRLIAGYVVTWTIPAHPVFWSTPWIHPRLRRRVHRRGRR